MVDVRPPAVSGMFYPSDPEVLGRTVRGLLDDAPRASGPAPHALIVPHAGYVYSGPTAAAAYATLAGLDVDRAVMIGPAHHVWADGLALPGVDAFRTPLGDVAVDREAEVIALRHPIVSEEPAVHSPEHSLEVQLPFLQTLFDDFAVLPLLTAAVDHKKVAGVIGEFLGAAGTVVVISSDLSHYLDYETARRRDERAATAIEGLDPEALDHESACGLVGVQAMLVAARQAGLEVHRLDLRNSGDTAGPRHRVVGYGAFAFGPSS